MQCTTHSNVRQNVLFSTRNSTAECTVQHTQLYDRMYCTAHATVLQNVLYTTRNCTAECTVQHTQRYVRMYCAARATVCTAECTILFQDDISSDGVGVDYKEENENEVKDLEETEENIFLEGEYQETAEPDNGFLEWLHTPVSNELFTV